MSTCTKAHSIYAEEWRNLFSSIQQYSTKEDLNNLDSCQTLKCHLASSSSCVSEITGEMIKYSLAATVPFTMAD